ncbi:MULTISPECIES: lipid-A-disaccharide synthase [unclassified Lysobacter]|uniref:lipid-A-disaccharide synthase n=1 Tax=unclassified Lysobacter TaxID=2635362 RepID=UPI001BE57235|nr:MULTISPECIES: lipid-A-disaccharide synthase [unclassified Lysobacter]MBT2748514.1 lipid-A-disaccharide synthase [Lysobacter sp. ISL-42]MBT2752879.1 lipid-A-disaccharide synthase [Lysobacter sp. ISL-50]MBT2775948.1 lipid-A-disaccharide synthase [Lysobacter sp. ISL-54]MBT2783789.1 lipid-A-disaccharide synthase [Lysobacter sp. ISL-52]
MTTTSPSTAINEIFPAAPPPPPRFALIAGEASGDLLGAGLIEELKRRYPGAEFVGIGGEQMRAAGMDTWFDATELAVMGLAEVLKHLPRLLRLRRDVRQRILDWKPDAFIGIDAPDFNLGVERWLKQRGVRTVHYVSPSVWAWRRKRAQKIGRSADRVLCLFPMEPPIYAEYGVDARFVGHPLADEMPIHPDRDEARMNLGLDDEAPVLAMLPGSRVGEIETLAGDFIAAASILLGAEPKLNIVAPMANASARAAFERVLAAHPDGERLRRALRVVDRGARAVMVASNVVLLASGTATLEAMLAKRPMVVGYKIAPLTYTLVKRMGMLKVDHYALPNVLAGEVVVPELMQHDCTPENLAGAVLRWLRDPAASAALLPKFQRIHLELKRDASARAADAIAELIAEPRPAA